MFRLLFGIVVGVLLCPVLVYLWFTRGNPPVAVADAPLPFERQITHIPLHARINRDMPKTVPIQPTADNLIAGAHIYREQCSFCHGVYGNPSAVGSNMFPRVPQLWEKHHGDVVGVSDDPAGETYWKVANGIRLTGMPAYDKILTETQMWQVSVLLANADKPLPPEALNLLKTPLAYDVPPVASLPAMPVKPTR